MTLTVLIAHKGEWPELAELILPGVASYCQRHGYSLYVRHGTYYDESWIFTMQKTKWVRDFIRGSLDTKSGTEFYWVLDMDTLITNHTIPVLQFTDSEHNVFMASDVNGLNCGSYIVRGCEAVVEWYDRIIALREHTTSEQHGMQLLEKKTVKFKELLHPSINSIPYEHYPEYASGSLGDWNQGHLLAHLPGKNTQDRVRLLTEYQGRVVK